MTKPRARNKAAWVPFEWGLRFFGAAADREKRLDLERRMFALPENITGAMAFVRLRDEIFPRVWEEECLAIVRRLSAGDMAAIGRKDARSNEITDVPRELWGDGLPDVNGRAVTLWGDETWFDVRIMDRRPLPMDLAAQAYATAGSWFERIKQHQQAPPGHTDNRLHGRLYAEYLPGEPTPTEDEARELRGLLDRRIQARQFRRIKGPEGARVCPVIHDLGPQAHVEKAANLIVLAETARRRLVG